MITLIVLITLLTLCIMGLVIVTGAIAISPAIFAFGGFIIVDIIFFLGIKKLFE